MPCDAVAEGAKLPLLSSTPLDPPSPFARVDLFLLICVAAAAPSELISHVGKVDVLCVLELS